MHDYREKGQKKAESRDVKHVGWVDHSEFLQGECVTKIVFAFFIGLDDDLQMHAVLDCDCECPGYLNVLTSNLSGANRI